MLKLNSNHLALPALLPLADKALAHPGPHTSLDGWGLLEHFFSSPFHFGAIAAVALLLAVGAVWSVKRGR